MKTYVADTESTTDEANCFVWGFAVCEVGNSENVIIGNRLDDFMKWCEDQPENITVLFCNLKWDSQFILAWLLKNKFTHVKKSIDRKTKTFTTLITDKGLYYSIEVVFSLRGKRVNKVTFLDSYKLIPLSVEKIAETFKLPIKKLEIDYDRHNDLPEGAPLTDEEKEYLTHDVQIVAAGVDYFYSQGLDKMTIGSCALREYKTLVGRRNFERWFPKFTAKYHKDVKQTYRGGYCLVNPKFAQKEVGNGLVLDNNSIYSAVMYYELMPYGSPIYFKGEYVDDPVYPLYVQMIRCQFELKPGKLPTIQAKGSFMFRGSEYLTSSRNEFATLYLTSVDLQLFRENYDIYNIEYFYGWKFKAGTGFFDEYIEKWKDNKDLAKAENNPGLYLISKLYLNSLYGKFGTDITMRSKIPYMDKSGVVQFYDGEPEEKETLYIALASFVTSYARDITIRASQRITDEYNAGKSKIQWLYSDTDSLHILSDDFSVPEWLEIDDLKLGAFKIEGKFNRAKYLRAKCYLLNYAKDLNSDEYSYKTVVAGMPAECYEEVNFDNFKFGATYKGKKQPRIVKGGVILENIDFTIKR